MLFEPLSGPRTSASTAPRTACPQAKHAASSAFEMVITNHGLEGASVCYRIDGIAEPCAAIVAEFNGHASW